MGDITRDFDRSEFNCKCGCGANVHKVEHVQALQAIRDKACELAGREVPFIISSGTRCPHHNRDVFGKVTSEHLSGDGTDVKALDSRTKFLMVKAALLVGVTRIGVGPNFIHFGTSAYHDKEVLWIY